MAEVLRGLPAGSRFAELDREMLALVDTAAGPGERDEFVAMMRPLMEAARDTGIYARFDELAGARPDDPRVAGLAADLAGQLSEEMAALMLAHGSEGEWLDEMSAAQREVFRVLAKMLKDRAC